MSHPSSPPSRPFAFLPVMISALCALLVAQMAWKDPRYIVPFALIVAMTLLPAYLARRRMRGLLLSGDVKRVLGTWESSIDRVMYPETMAPLMTATAYASYGWIEAARRALDRAVKGPAWDAALEQRLFVEALLDTFEGDRAASIAKAEALERMPLPAVGFLARRKIARLRRGIAALARAFAHQSLQSDAKLLDAAASSSPLVYWALRYGAAIVAVDAGQADRARDLVNDAPEWPRESAFQAFHHELVTHVV